jgi:hypothetical protein
MHTHITRAQRAIVLGISFCLPTLAWAAPGNVTGIEATEANGQIHIRWNAAAGDVASYHVFYSHASILENEGLYDDFETVPGTLTEHTLEASVPSGDVYVSVLAVDSSGEESDVFAEEARINRVETGAQDSGSLKLLSVQTLSSTGITLQFSHPPIVAREEAASAFTIRDASGALLPIVRLITIGKTVTLHTVPQDGSKIYQLRISGAVRGQGAGDTTISLDPAQGPMLFQGIAGGAAQVITTTASDEIQDLALRAVPDDDGTYTVQATWRAVGPNVAAIEIAQSTDGGETFGATQRLEASVNGISIKRALPGTFGIAVRLVLRDGTTAKGIFKSIDLPGATPSSTPAVTASVTEPAPAVTTTPTSTRPSLPSSGMGLSVVIAMLGGVIGYRRMYRHKVAA